MEERNAPDGDEARRKYRRLAAVYDRRIRFAAPIRRRVIDRLCLQPGEHVLDMGCGTGASFAALREVVGPTGRVTGVELSEEMAAVACTRIADQGWDNVDVVVGDATEAPLPSDVDAVLLFLVHDLTRLPRVVERAVAAGRVGPQVVAFGAVRQPPYGTSGQRNRQDHCPSLCHYVRRFRSTMEPPRGSGTGFVGAESASGWRLHRLGHIGREAD